jgi:diadenosine tetraphosphate (Ap4A) HIT family hydrolase
MSISVTKAYRDENVQAAYERFKQTWPSDKCPFCEIPREPIYKGTYFNVVKNDFPYLAYDGVIVVDHLLIIPHEHIYALKECSEEARQELVDCISNFEADNYNVYIRAPGNDRRTVAHHHGHLIKLGTVEV